MTYIAETPCVTKKAIYITPNGLRFRSPEGEFYEWEKITNIFSTMKPEVLTVINEDGKASTGFVFPDKINGSVKEKIDLIFRTWQECIEANVEVEIFVYPIWANQTEKTARKQNVFWGIFGGLIIIIMGILALRENGWKIVNLKEGGIIIFTILFGLNGLRIGFSNIKKLKRNIIDVVAFNEDGLEVIYNNGDSITFDLSQVEKHTLNKGYTEGKLIFKDGLILENLDLLSYWPILRKYLLGRLEKA